MAALLLPQAAQADYFVWNDPQTGLSMTYPDTWRLVHSQDPDTIMTIMAPSGRAHATCVVRAGDDHRFDIYPVRYDWAIQATNFNYDYWERYMAHYQNPQIETVVNGAGHGRGYASYAIASYDSEIKGPMMARKALMFVSHYNNRTYVTECSAHRDAFDYYKHIFLSVAGSVDFKKVPHETTGGHYRNFINDPSYNFIDLKGNRKTLY